MGPMGKTWRWCRRKPVLAGMTASVVTLLLTVTAVSVASAWRIASARKGEQREAYYSNIALASKLIEEGSIDRALETLWKCPEQYRHWEWGHLLYLCHQEAASFQAHTTNFTATVFSPDGRWVVTHDAVGIAKVWDWEAEQVGLQLREFIEPGELDHLPTERRAVGGDPGHQRGLRSGPRPTGQSKSGGDVRSTASRELLTRFDHPSVDGAETAGRHRNRRPRSKVCSSLCTRQAASPPHWHTARMGRDWLPAAQMGP